MVPGDWIELRDAPSTGVSLLLSGEEEVILLPLLEAEDRWEVMHR